MNKLVTPLLLTSLLGGCVALPDVYLIDRHTVMEAEAAGEWPELERRFQQSAIRQGPEALPSEGENRRQQNAFRLLNGEYVSQSDTSADARSQP